MNPLTRPPAFPRPEAGRIVEVTSPGMCTYTLDGQPGRTFGPAPYPQWTTTVQLPDALGDLTITLPDPDVLAGADCVIIHVTDEPDGARVIPYPEVS